MSEPSIPWADCYEEATGLTEEFRVLCAEHVTKPKNQVHYVDKLFGVNVTPVGVMSVVETRTLYKINRLPPNLRAEVFNFWMNAPSEEFIQIRGVGPAVNELLLEWRKWLALDKQGQGFFVFPARAGRRWDDPLVPRDIGEFIISSRVFMEILDKVKSSGGSKPFELARSFVYELEGQSPDAETLKAIRDYINTALDRM